MGAEMFVQLVAEAPGRSWQFLAMAGAWQTLKWTRSRAELWLFLRLTADQRPDALAWEGKTPPPGVDDRKERQS